MTTPKITDLLKLVNKVARATHLDAVRILRGSFQVEALPNAPTETTAALGSSFAFDRSVTKDHLLSRVSFSLDVQQSGTPPLHAVTVKATIELSYKMTAEFEEAELDCFAKVNGIYHAWPYWREFVQNSTTRAGLPPLTLHPIQAGEAMVMAGFVPPAAQGQEAKH